jgi:hypothetical protein
MDAVRKWLHRQDRNWYWQGIHALVPHWRKDKQVDGDYVKKIVQHSFILSPKFNHF